MPFIDAAINQYVTVLGDFSFDDFEGNEYYKVVWVMFILTTFFGNIVFLNMIIAIMADTYNKVSLDSTRYGLIERTRLFSDYMPFIKLSKNFKDQ